MAESNNFLTLGINKENAYYNIRMAFIVGVIVLAITLIGLIVTIFYKPVLGLNAWGFVDLIVLAILTYGIYRESRVAAVIMAVLWPIEKIVQSGVLGGIPPASLAIAVLFEIAFIRGAIATFLIEKKKGHRKQARFKQNLS